jgi:hypothetical protein
MSYFVAIAKNVSKIENHRPTIQEFFFIFTNECNQNARDRYEAVRVEQLVTNLSFSDSIWAFWVGLPGSMKCSWTTCVTRMPASALRRASPSRL